MTKDNKTSPSAFIPFCEFGGDMSGVGVKLEQFDDPACHSFQAKILNDKLCYEVDLNLYSNQSNKAQEVEFGFSFVMDYNEDRQVTIQSNISKVAKRSGMSENILKAGKNQHAFIYLDTIGKNIIIKSHLYCHIMNQR